MATLLSIAVQAFIIGGLLVMLYVVATGRWYGGER